MARNEKRRQKARARRKRRSAHRRAGQQRREGLASGLAGVKSIIRHARDYPIHECLINPTWRERGMAHIVLSRKQPGGLIAFGVYLVDVYCLGVKNAFCNANVTTAQYENKLKAPMADDQRTEPCPPALAHEIIYGSIDYARRLGFRPHKDFGLAQCLLEPRGHFEETGGVEFGKDGGPLFVAGPDDNVPRILRTLENSVGEGNFHYIVPADGFAEGPAAPWQ